jgi:hypothetical protein
VGNDHGARRRKLLGIGVAVVGSAMIEPANAQTKKVPKEQAQYQDKPKNDQECEYCLQFVAPSSCKLVEGTVNPHGWCMFFAPKPK